MTKGTTSFGPRGRAKTHIRCRRCGRHAYHVRKKKCAYCGFGATATIRTYRWYKYKSQL